MKEEGPNWGGGLKNEGNYCKGCYSSAMTVFVYTVAVKTDLAINV